MGRAKRIEQATAAIVIEAVVETSPCGAPTTAQFPEPVATVDHK
jgi:hypothetical protein